MTNKELLKKLQHIKNKPEQIYKNIIILQAQGNFDQAFHDTKVLAENNFAPAQFELGYMYFSGKGAESSLEKATYWWKKALENGYKDAEVIMNLLKINEMTL
jgi:TPR repeat protein